MDIIQITLVSALLTIGVSFAISAMIKLMVLFINKFGKPEAAASSASPSDTADLSDIAALIAIVKSQKLNVKVGSKV